MGDVSWNEKTQGNGRDFLVHEACYQIWQREAELPKNKDSCYDNYVKDLLTEEEKKHLN